MIFTLRSIIISSYWIELPIKLKAKVEGQLNWGWELARLRIHMCGSQRPGFGQSS
jgi:hypothetical protein